MNPPDPTPAPGPGRAVRSHGAAGFSLVELIGVLSIAALLGTMAVHAVISRLRLADQQAEAATMASLGRALEKAILDHKILPGTNDWVTWVTPEMESAPARISHAKAGDPRLLLYHPDSAIRPGATARLQTVSGFPPGTNRVDRLILVSTLQGGFPTNLQPADALSFERLWDTRPGQRPSGWTSQALPDPGDLQIIRLDLNRWLHQVTLNNLATAVPSVTVSSSEDGTVLTINRPTPNAPWQARFLHGSGLNLHGLTNEIVRCERITGDRTLYFGDDGWGGSRSEVNSAALRTLVADFLGASFPDAINQQRPRAAIDELYRTLWSYMEWEEGGFLEGGNNKNQAPDAYVVRSTVARLNQGTLNLIGSGGGGGGGNKDK